MNFSSEAIIYFSIRRFRFGEGNPGFLTTEPEVVTLTE